MLDLLDPSILGISSDLRRIALIIILIKAGLSLNLPDLKKVGRPAVLMAFLPACAEIVGADMLYYIFLQKCIVFLFEFFIRIPHNTLIFVDIHIVLYRIKHTS